VENEDSDGSQLDEDSDLAGQYDYLLGMTMWTLTKEKKDELLKKRDDKLAELAALQGKTPATLWKEDLDAFLQEVCCEKGKWWLLLGICHLKATGSLFYVTIIS
jgi:DNA topoisomerase-2